jgi:hypothetical protein
MPRAQAARGESFSMTFTLPGVDGWRCWLEATGRSIRNGGTDRSGVVVIGGNLL